MSIETLLDEINLLKATLDLAPKLNIGEQKRIREHFAVEYTYNSNAIEGNTLSLRETALVVLEGLTIDKKPIKDHLEAIGHKQAFDYVLSISGISEKLSEQTIKEIHALVLMNDPQNKGKYRDLPVKISGALDVPPHPSEIPEKMRSLVAAYGLDKRHPIVRIAEFHMAFERIHPFIDGNGRTGRLIMNLELIKSGYCPVDVKYADRGLYIDCFRDFEETGNTERFVEMIAKYELSELSKQIELTNCKDAIVSEKCLSKNHWKQAINDNRGGDTIEIIKSGESIILKPTHGIEWYLQDYERPDGGWEHLEPKGREEW